MRYIFGEGLLYSHFTPPICQGGEIAIFRGGIYYIAIFPPIQVTGGNGSIPPDWCLLQIILSLFLK